MASINGNPFSGIYMQWCAQGRVTTESDPGADDIEWSGQLYVVESRLRASDVTNALNGDFSGFEAVISPPGEPARLVDPFVPVSRQCGAPCRGGTIQTGTTDHPTMYIKGLSAYIHLYIYPGTRNRHRRHRMRCADRPSFLSGIAAAEARTLRQKARAACRVAHVCDRARSAGGPHPLDRLHLDLVRSIAMVELLIEGWCEPPAPQALHLSTVCHQVLSVIAERGGVNAVPLYEVLCRTGPFKKVNQEMFVRLLRDLGSPETALIEQAPDGTILLGPQGEKLVEHYSFYAVFQSVEEFRVVASGRQIGSLPAANVFVPDMTIQL